MLDCRTLLAGERSKPRLKKLRILIPHGGGYVPYQIGRFANAHKHRPAASVHTKTSPADLLRRFYFDALTHDPRSTRHLINMAGADRVTRNSTTADLGRYRDTEANQTANGLDRRYGAGQLNIQNSYHIITAGEQNSAEDGGPGAGTDLVVAALGLTPTVTITGRTTLFSVAGMANGTPHANYDVSPDGQTFAMVGFNMASRIVIIQNLPALMAKLRGGTGSAP